MGYTPTISHEEVDALQTASFKGEIIVIDSENEDYKEAIEYLSRQRIIGFDTETRPTFQANAKIKVGAAVHDDIKGLQHYKKFIAKGFVDLQTVGENWGIKEKSVKKMAAIILGFKISKSQQLSNWEAQELTPAQIQYAAIDAWACQKMYLKLLSTPKVVVQKEEA